MMTGNVTLSVWRDEIEVHGDTYENKEFIKSLGGKFERDYECYWVVPASAKDALVEAGAVVEFTSDKKRTIRKGDRFEYDGKKRIVVSVNFGRYAKIYYGTFAEGSDTNIIAGDVRTMSLKKAMSIIL